MHNAVVYKNFIVRMTGYTTFALSKNDETSLPVA